MDKTAIKNFSIWARNKLIADITYKAGLLGVAEEGIKDALPQSTQDAEFYDIGTKEPYVIHGEEIKQRKELVAAIKRKASQLDYKDAYRNVVEEVAYTWFNRLIAIRFMEVNDYMPAHIRVLSSDSKNKLEPDLVTTPFDAELEFTQAETDKIMQMKTDNQVDALFRFLFIKQCNALNAYLPKLFEKTFDYTELLLNVSVTDQDGIVYHLTHDMNEDDFNISNIGEDGKPTGQVEIIGWMYQYYNTEPKDEAFALLKKNVKITKERIPAATQLFTPDWIVRYMVENSVGRLWLEGHEDSNLKNEWKYYLDEAEQEADVTEQLRAIREEYKNIKPEEIKVIDPCMGSGHILVYAFDVLMQIYESYGYSQRDAARSIVENNIYGLDIDDRAFQLAYFAIMMKARSYNRRFLALEIEPNLCGIQESNGLRYDKEVSEKIFSEKHQKIIKYLLSVFVNAKEYGSILNVEKRDYLEFLESWNEVVVNSSEDLITMIWLSELNDIMPTLAKQAYIMTGSYDSVITNPPYMGNMPSVMTEYVREYYADEKYDLYAVFMKKGIELAKNNAYVAMITQQAWMFLSSFEQLRNNLNGVIIMNMLHLGARAFEEISGEVVQTTTFVLNKYRNIKYQGRYFKLLGGMSQKDKEEMFLRQENIFVCSQSKFSMIPGKAYAYWVNDKLLEKFSENTLSDYSTIKSGIVTGNNDYFLKLWYEIDFEHIGFSHEVFVDNTDIQWVPMNKGGGYKKHYGLQEYVMNLHDIWEPSKTTNAVRRGETSFYFREGLTWSTLATSLSVRYCPKGFVFDTKGSMCFPEKKETIYYLEALLNSKVASYVMDFLSPTLDYNQGAMGKIPVDVSEKIFDRVTELSKQNISIAKKEWDSFETSWNFKRHFLVREGHRLSEIYSVWQQECEDRYNTLKKNEEEINSLFIELYGLEDELTSEVEEKYISITRADKQRDIKSLVSYIVGCIMGRYSYQKDGLVIASKFMADMSDVVGVDNDNIIPITDEEYLEDDIVSCFCKWIAVFFGQEYVEENLQFVSEALGEKGGSSREIIRNYFLKSYFAEHKKNYQKHPIYWLFDSGKQNGFKALIYMYRYNADTIGNLRVDYLHRMERIYESEINRMQDTIDNSSNAREVTAATKRKEKLQKQLKECQEYDEKIGHLALSRIDIDLDDGVKVNYEKVQTANDGKKYQVLAKI